MATDAYDDVLSRARELSSDEQRLLVKDLSSVPSSNGDSRRSLLELKGLGKEVWAGVDAQEYVRRERASWTG